MTQVYNITGMSCGGCRSNVENALNNIDQIDAQVTLNPPVATVNMQHHIPVEQLQHALTKVGAYTITIAQPS